MNELMVWKIFAGTGWLLLIVAAAWLADVRAKNAAQERTEELHKPQEQPRAPSRVAVRILQGGAREIVYGSKFDMRNGYLTITDQEGLIAAVFGPGKWVSAIVEAEPAKPQSEPTKFTTAVDDSFVWNPYNKVVQSHRNGAMDFEATNREREKRGLPTPWTPEIAEKEVKEPPCS